MSWKDRLRPGITLTSPEGNTFTAKWRGDDLSVSKRINRVSHPDIDGESVQDLGRNSWDYPLTLWFDGSDHDTEALRFSRAIAERGLWDITHPVYGLLRLQPVKITIRAHPVESGNITEVSGDWFEPVSDTSAVSSSSASAVRSSSAVSGKFRWDIARTPGAGSAASAGAKKTGRSAASAAPARIASPSDNTAAVEAAVTALSESAVTDAARITARAAASAAESRASARQFRKGLDTVKAFIRWPDDRLRAIMGTIEYYYTRAYLDIASLSGAVIQLLESPGLFLGNAASQVSRFVSLGKRLVTDLPAAWNFSRDRIIAAAITGELWINAVNCGLGRAVIRDLPETRAGALSILARYREFADVSRAALDALAKASASASIEEQYFPRAASAEAILTLNAAVARYIMEIAFDLKTEKRLVLDRPTSPLLLAVKEYGATAAGADAAFDLLCRSNNLHGRELLLLDRMREVVIYA